MDEIGIPDDARRGVIVDMKAWYFSSEGRRLRHRKVDDGWDNDTIVTTERKDL